MLVSQKDWVGNHLFFKSSAEKEDALLLRRNVKAGVLKKRKEQQL